MSGHSLKVSAVDYHTAGEPFRIVADWQDRIPGESVIDRREWAESSSELDRVRKLLVNEPRGHADMYGGFIVPPNDPGADFGVLFWHGDGYSTACGHGTIALGAWAIDSGLVNAEDNGETPVTIDVPSGRVEAIVERQSGRTTQISFRNVFSHQIAKSVEVEISSGQKVSVGIGYGGANYASLNATQLGLEIVPENLTKLISIGREVKWLLNDQPVAKSQGDSRLNGIYGTILYEELARSEEHLHHRNVTIYADGRVDRSPCGSGTASRIAELHQAGDLTVGMELVHDSIIGSRFLGRVEKVEERDGVTGVIPLISGIAHQTGRSEFTLDDSDELGTGFSLR